MQESEAEVIKKYGVDIIALNGTYIANPENRGAIILNGDGPCRVEEYACRHFRRLGYNTLFVESVPFHVLFGVYMWHVIQDPVDSHTRIISFEDRKAFDDKTPGELISTHLPDDFGTPGYRRRRRLNAMVVFESVLLLSSYITGSSRIMIRRTIQERVKAWGDEAGW